MSWSSLPFFAVERLAFRTFGNLKWVVAILCQFSGALQQRFAKLWIFQPWVFEDLQSNSINSLVCSTHFWPCNYITASADRKIVFFRSRQAETETLRSNPFPPGTTNVSDRYTCQRQMFFFWKKNQSIFKIGHQKGQKTGASCHFCHLPTLARTCRTWPRPWPRPSAMSPPPRRPAWPWRRPPSGATARWGRRWPRGTRRPKRRSREGSTRRTRSQWPGQNRPGWIQNFGDWDAGELFRQQNSGLSCLGFWTGQRQKFSRLLGLSSNYLIET